MGDVRELRNSPRVPVTHLLIGFADGERFFRGNVSSGGVGFEIGPDEPVSVQVGDAITVRLALPEAIEPIACGARVEHVRTDEAGRVVYAGASFVEADELVQYPLERFVEESVLLEKSPSGAVMMPNL